MEENKKVSQSSYKDLFLRLKNIIVTPEKEWIEIKYENRTLNDIITNYSLPLIGFLSILTFLSELIDTKKFIWEIALKKSAITFISLFGGLLLSYLLLKKLSKLKLFSNIKGYYFELIAYPSGFIYIVLFLVILIPELFFFRFATLFIGYIYWRMLKDKLSILAVIVLTFIILVIPEIISYIFYLFN